MYLKNYKVSRYFRLTAVPVILFFFGMTFSCAGVGSKSPAAVPVVTPSALKPEPESAPKPGRSKRKGDPIQEAYKNFAMASFHMAGGDYEKARDYLLETLKIEPDSIYLNKKMLILLQRLKEIKGAIEYARKCIELDPDDIEVRILSAETHSLAGDMESAIGDYEKVLKLDPEYRKVRMILTTILIRTRQFRAALEQLNTLIQQDPDSVIANYYRGRIHLELDNFQEAEKDYLRTLELNKSMEPALFDLASQYQLQKRYEEAAEIYERLLGFYPDNMVAKERLISAYYKLGQEEKVDSLIADIKENAKPGEPGRQTLGLIYLQHGRLDESITELDLIVAAWPEDQKSRYYLALAYEENGDREKAIEHFMQIKKGPAYYINSRIHLAYILDDQKKPDEAIHILQEAIEVEKGKAELYLILASIFERRQEYRKAIEVIDKGLLQEAENIELIFRLGVILEKSGDKKRSIKQMRRVLEIDPGHADALNYIGYTFAEKGVRLDEALEMIQKALEIKPNSGYIIDSLGWVYFQKGLYEEALGYLERAFSIIPNDPTVAEHLGDVYRKKKEYQRSLEMYQKSISLKHQNEDAIKEKIEEVMKLLQ